MHLRFAGLAAGLSLLALLVAPSIGCDRSEDFSGEPRAEAPDEPMVNSRNAREQRREGRRSGQTSLPSDHPPVESARGDRDRGGASAPAGSGGPSGSGGADLPVEWTAPDGWTETEPSSSMRAAQYRLPGAGGAGAATLAIFHFSGKGGGSVTANIDRWVGQFSKPGGGSAEESAEITRKTVNGLDVHVVDVSGTYSPGAGMGGGGEKKSQRMLGAIAETSAGHVFFKLVGPQPTVAEHREEFRSLVESFRPAG